MMQHQEKTPENKTVPASSINRGNTAVQLKDNREHSVVQQKLAEKASNQESSFTPIQRKANTTGLPDTLKSGIENLSGHSMDDVKVHYNSAQPAQLNAHAYAQGSDIHIASGQEKHLPHEAWHVVQQKQGRVKPTLQMKSKVNINDDKGLENEADAMGAKALSTVIQEKQSQSFVPNLRSIETNTLIQRFVYRKVDDNWEKTEKGEAPPILIQTLAELEEKYPNNKKVIKEIFESHENRLLLYRLDNKSAIISEVDALMERISRPPEEDKRKKGNAWRTGKADKEFKEVAAKDKDGFDTGHHKLAKSKIQWLYDLLSQKQKTNLIARLDLPSNSGVNALKSLYSNLTFGPGSGDRDEDPGRKLDPNHHTARPALVRSMTHRSLQYHNLDTYLTTMMTPVESGPARESISDEEYTYIARCFETAEKLHAVITNGGGLDTNKTMWVKKQQDWEKRDLPEPIDLPENIDDLLEKPLRELKTQKNRSIEEGFSLTKEDRARLIIQLEPARTKINAQLEKKPNNIELLLWKALLTSEVMDLMGMGR